jgi:cobalt/nickel transport system permease protein
MSASHCNNATILDAAAPAPRSLVARLDPRTRVVLALLFAVAIVAVETLPALGLALGGALALAVLARLKPSLLLRRMLALEGFMVVVLALLPFSVPGTPLVEVAGIAASAEGLARALAIILKANAVVVAVLALLGSLEVVALGRALGRLGAPQRFVHLFLFTVRYVAVLEREYRRLRLAMRARAFRPTTGLHCWRSVGYLFGMLIIRSLERAERIDAAMRLRGFTGHFPSLEDEHAGPGILDWGFGAASTAAMAAFIMVGLG